MSAWVLLRHDLPDGSWHLDWLLEPPPAPGALSRLTSANPNERSLISFRLPATLGANWRPDVPGIITFTAEMLPPHRRHYLTYEGDIGGGGRGRVSRIAESPDGVQVVAITSDRVEITLRPSSHLRVTSIVARNPLPEGGGRGWVPSEKPIPADRWVRWIATPLADAPDLWQFIQEHVLT